MQTPVEIDFQGLKGNEQLRSCVTKNISVLEQRFGRITACRVVVRAPSDRHRTGGACVMKNISVLEQRFGRITACRVVIRAPSDRHRTGGACEIAIRLSLPQGREVDIGRSEKADDRFADPVVALNDAFKRARRRLQDHARRMRGQVKSHDGPPIATVKRFDDAAGFGFLETPDGREIYFHKNSVLDGSRQVPPGTRVTFFEEMGEKGPQASTVKVLGKHGLR